MNIVFKLIITDFLFLNLKNMSIFQDYQKLTSLFGPFLFFISSKILLPAEASTWFRYKKSINNENIGQGK